ncbi:MAG: hypothetical protein JWM16_5648 [Verrucomicrobiales bacterium]|nr:hypothetical protein [Verrucomicrobiales bacterium]
MIPDKAAMFLNLRRLPALLDVYQTAVLLGRHPKCVIALVSAGLLKPLGSPAKNGQKFFASTAILELAENDEWLHQASRAIAKYWKNRKSGGGDLTV